MSNKIKYLISVKWEWAKSSQNEQNVVNYYFLNNAS